MDQVPPERVVQMAAQLSLGAFDRSQFDLPTTGATASVAHIGSALADAMVAALRVQMGRRVVFSAAADTICQLYESRLRSVLEGLCTAVRFVLDDATATRVRKAVEKAMPDALRPARKQTTTSDTRPEVFVGIFADVLGGTALVEAALAALLQQQPGGSADTLNLWRANAGNQALRAAVVIHDPLSQQHWVDGWGLQIGLLLRRTSLVRGDGIQLLARLQEESAKFSLRNAMQQQQQQRGGGGGGAGGGGAAGSRNQGVRAGSGGGGGAGGGAAPATHQAPQGGAAPQPMNAQRLAEMVRAKAGRPVSDEAFWATFRNQPAYRNYTFGKQCNFADGRKCKPHVLAEQAVDMIVANLPPQQADG
mgnify:CR=1 FL=1